MEDLKLYCTDLVERNNILFSPFEEEISYPEKGNSDCFQLEDNSFWFTHRNKCIIQLVKQYSPKSLFFDIGGGNGFVARGLEESNIKSVLVEPGMQGCVNAQKRGLKNVICAPFNDTIFKDNSIGAIGTFDVVEHIEDDLAFLKLIYKKLSEGGYYFLTVPAYNFLWSKDDEYAGHYRRYTLNTISKKLMGIGFSIEYSTYIFSILPLPVFLSRTLPSLVKLPYNPENINAKKQTHNKKKNIIGDITDAIWEQELSLIRKNKKIPFGGSCLVVAKKH